jgi:hypothetical protein
MDLPKQIGGLYHAGSVGIIMSGWLGAINYGVIVANEAESLFATRAQELPKKDPLDDIERFAVDGGPPDLATNHDHYAYGLPKSSVN